MENCVLGRAMLSKCLTQFSVDGRDCVSSLWFNLRPNYGGGNEDHGIWSHHSMGNRWVNSGNSVRLYFLGSKITADGDCSHEIKRHLLLEEKL